MKFLKSNFLSNNSRTECVGMAGVWGWQVCGGGRRVEIAGYWFVRIMGMGRILGVIFFHFQNCCIVGKTLCMFVPIHMER